MPVLSEIYAYNASEYVMQPSNVGGDRGTSIHSGVRVLCEGIPGLQVDPGLPTEFVWPYQQYCRRASEFVRCCQGLTVQSPHVTEVKDLPPWDDMLAALAAAYCENESACSADKPIDRSNKKFVCIRPL